MRSFIIYLIIFILAASFIRGTLGVKNLHIGDFEIPNIFESIRHKLKKVEEDVNNSEYLNDDVNDSDLVKIEENRTKKENLYKCECICKEGEPSLKNCKCKKISNSAAAPAAKKPVKKKKPRRKNDMLLIFGFDIEKSMPIEKVNLEKSLYKHLGKKWISKDPNRQPLYVYIHIAKNKISKNYYNALYRQELASVAAIKYNLTITYTIYGYKKTNKKEKILSRKYRYKVLIKSHSKLDYMDAERLAEIKLFKLIGKDLAKKINSRYNYLISFTKPKEKKVKKN